jgi:hypothetical protein
MDGVGESHSEGDFELLLERPRAVVELAGELPGQSSRGVAASAGAQGRRLVLDRADGTRRIYRVEPDGLVALRADLERFWGQALAAYNAVVEQATEEHE